MGAPMGNRNAVESHGTKIKGNTKKASELRTRRITARKNYDKWHPKGTLHARK